MKLPIDTVRHMEMDVTITNLVENDDSSSPSKNISEFCDPVAESIPMSIVNANEPHPGFDEKTKNCILR